MLLAAGGFSLILRRPSPLLDDRFHLPPGGRIDRNLIGGSVLFGLGWGMAGYCPGPAIAGLGIGNPEALWVVPSVALGVFLQRWWAGRAGDWRRSVSGTLFPPALHRRCQHAQDFEQDVGGILCRDARRVERR